MNLQPGDTFEGYKILSRLGEGGMGSVYLAMDGTMQRKVAIKVMDWHDDEASRRSFSRFQQEAKALCAIRHANVVVAHRFAITEGKQGFLVMDYVDGTTLRELIGKEGPLNSERSAAIFVQVCDALVQVHEKGIIHRDLKPENIMLEKNEDGSELVRIVDFGISRSMAQDLKMTKTGQLLGTPLYMSPEQWGAEELDARSDLWSFGCVMYETLTGKTPFSLDELACLLTEQDRLKPAAFGKACPDLIISNRLEKIVRRALNVNREDRFQSALEILAALQALPELTRFKANPTLFMRAAPRRSRLRLFLFQHRKQVVLAVSAATVTAAVCLVLQDPERRADAEGVLVRLQNLCIPKSDPRGLSAILRLARSYADCHEYLKAVRVLEPYLNELLESSSQISLESLSESCSQLGDWYGKMPQYHMESVEAYKKAFSYDNQLLKDRKFLEANPAVLKRIVKNARIGSGFKSDDYHKALIVQQGLECQVGAATGDRAHYLVAVNCMRMRMLIKLEMDSLGGQALENSSSWQEELLRRIKELQAPEQLEFAGSLCEIGNLYQLAGDDQLAVKSFRNALEICGCPRTLKVNSRHYKLDGIEICAGRYNDAGKFELAIPLYEAVLKARQVAGDPGAAGTELALAYTCARRVLSYPGADNKEQGRRGELHFQSYLKENQLNDEGLYRVLLSLANCQKAQDKNLEVLATYQRARELCLKQGGVCQKYWVQATQYYGSALGELKRFKEDLPIVASLVRYGESHTEMVPCDLLRLTVELSWLQSQEGLFQDAEQSCRKARIIVEQLKKSGKISNSDYLDNQRSLEQLENKIRMKKSGP
jgi:serine/threonine protein kinase